MVFYFEVEYFIVFEFVLAYKLEDVFKFLYYFIIIWEIEINDLIFLKIINYLFLGLLWELN